MTRSTPPVRGSEPARPRALAGTLAVLLTTLLAACDGTPGRGGSYGEAVVLAAPSDSGAEFGLVAPFSLVERSGATVTNETLAGRPYVASFFFASCAGPCPALLGQMSRAQRELAGSDVRLVSITVDPERDTPEVLRAKADAFTADPERWLFLTGPEADITALMRRSFALALDKLPTSDTVAALEITHDTKMVVVDGEGRVRGYYDGMDPKAVDAAVARARWLAAHGKSDPR